MKYEVLEYDGLNNTPAVNLIAMAQVELLANGYGPRELQGAWDQQALVAIPVASAYRHPHQAVGLITYSHEKWRKLIWIHLGYVAPEFRGRGVYRLLWDRLVIAARKAKALEIHGGTSVKNSAMLECARKLGREQVYITTRFVVPPEPPKRKSK